MSTDPSAGNGAHPVSTERAYSVFGRQCHRCVKVRKLEDGLQPLSCSCNRRFYCSEICKADDAITHQDYCADDATFERITERNSRDTMAIAYDASNRDDLIEHAVEHILIRWIMECKYSDGTQEFPIDPLEPDSWKTMFKEDLYYHFKFEIQERPTHRWARLAEMSLRPIAEFSPTQLERVRELCDTLHPAIVFGYTVVDLPYNGGKSLPYISIKVHQVPIEVARTAIERGHHFANRLISGEDFRA